MSRDIKNFNNGIDVDSVADRIAAGDNDALAQFFSRRRRSGISCSV